MKKIKVSQNLINLAKIFSAPLYITGGYVRNSLLGLPVYDTDICSPLPPQKVIQLLSCTPYKVASSINSLGTLKIICGDEKYEYTTLRKDIYGKGGQHRPQRVEFCDSVLSDAQRRDFTVNAIYYDIINEKITDPLGGAEDLNNKIIRAYDPQKIFSSDGLRLLRMVRFACELGFDIDQSTFSEAKNCHALLKDIKGERIFEELYKILVSDTKYNINDSPHYRGVKMLKELNLLPIIFPGMELCYGVSQREDFHKYDVFEHTAQTVKYSHSGIRLAALLHDIGKGIMFRENANFYKHEITGSEKAKQLLGQSGLKCPNKLIEETVFLIKYHMYDINGKTKDNKIRLFIAKNQKYLDKLLLLKQADYLGCGIKNDISPTVLRWLKLQRQMIKEGAPFSLKDLNIGGEDILRLGCKEQHIKIILARLLDECIITPRLNKKEILLDKAKRYIYLINKKGTI